MRKTAQLRDSATGNQTCQTQISPRDRKIRHILVSPQIGIPARFALAFLLHAPYLANQSRHCESKV